MAGVVIGETNSFPRHLVDARGLDDFLTVAAEIAVSQVIGEDVNEVWLFRASEGREKEDQDGNELHVLAILRIAGPTDKSAKMGGSDLRPLVIVAFVRASLEKKRPSLRKNNDRFVWISCGNILKSASEIKNHSIETRVVFLIGPAVDDTNFEPPISLFF